MGVVHHKIYGRGQMVGGWAFNNAGKFQYLESRKHVHSDLKMLSAGK